MKIFDHFFKGKITNQGLMKSLDPGERAFSWKMCQDLLEVGARSHRKGAKKECTWIKSDGFECQCFETVEHKLFLCDRVRTCSDRILEVVREFLGKDIDRSEILFLNFNARNRRKLGVCIWFVVKAFHIVFKGNADNRMIWQDTVKDVNWCFQNRILIHAGQDMERLRGIISAIST